MHCLFVCFCVYSILAYLYVRVRACLAYMVAAGHEERSKDDHHLRMLAMAKVLMFLISSF